MNKSLIFCQSPAFLPVVLSCYGEEQSKGRQVIIVVRNAYGMFKFLDSLNLEARICFFENPVTSGVQLLGSHSTISTQIKSDIRSLSFENAKDNNVFFTDMLDDFIQALYLKELIFCSISWIIDERSVDRRPFWFNNKSVPYKLRLLCFVYSYLYNIKFIPAKTDHWTIAFDVNEFGNGIRKYDISKIKQQYRFKVACHGAKKAIFYTEPYRNSFQTKEDYDLMNKNIIDELHSLGYIVLVKGHPRIGCNEVALQYSDEEIPSYIPAEFVNLRDFDLAIGFVSTSLCISASEIPSYSVLPMCSIVNKEEADYWKEYLMNNSKERVVLLSSFSEI